MRQADLVQQVRARVNIAAGTTERARSISDALRFIDRPIDVMVDPLSHASWAECRLLVWDMETALKRRELSAVLERLDRRCEVILLLPELDARWTSYYLELGQLNHFVVRSDDQVDAFHSLVRKINGGGIFGLERHVPASVEIHQTELRTYEDRCDALDTLEAFSREQHFSSRVRRNAGHAAEELLMNAMYAAPVDLADNRLFADFDPALRIKQRTPRPVTFRFAAHERLLLVSVRDEFGSLDRQVVARYLLRCVTDDNPMEDKKLGAGLGLFQVTTTANQIVFNIHPGRMTEVICVLGTRSTDLNLVSVLSTDRAEPGLSI